MSIEKIKGYFESSASPKSQASSKSATGRMNLPRSADSVSFSGNRVKPFEEFLLEKMPWFTRAMVKMHKGMGEIQNQLINAFGTGMVAPIFIMFNPISDKDQDTKTYTAMRQPISAILAIATQTAIVIPFNRMIQHDSDIGYYSIGKNATFFPSDTYLKPIVKKLPENKGKYPFWKLLFSKEKRQELKDAISDYRYQNYESKLIDMIKEDEIVFNTTNGRTVSTEKMPKKDFITLFKETVESIITEEEQERINAVKNKLPKKIERGIFFYSYPEKSMAVIDRLYKAAGCASESLGLNPEESKGIHKRFGIECGRIKRELKSDMRKHPENKQINTELLKIIKELKRWNYSPDDEAVQALREKVAKVRTNAQRMTEMPSTKAIENYVSKCVTRRTDAIDETINTMKQISDRLDAVKGKSSITVAQAQELIDETIKNSKTKVDLELAQRENVTEKERTFAHNESAAARLQNKAKSIAKCIADQQKKHVKANISGAKRWTGLFVSLGILPATCWMLNRIYPWAMDRLFPGLSGKETPKDKKDEVEA